MFVMTGKVGVNCFIYDTDDGSLEAVNINTVKELQAKTNIPVIQNGQYVIPYTAANFLGDGKNLFTESGVSLHHIGKQYYFEHINIETKRRKKYNFIVLDDTHIRFSTGIIVQVTLEIMHKIRTA